MQTKTSGRPDPHEISRPMSSSYPDKNLTGPELENLIELELMVRQSLHAYLALGAALAEIRDAQLYRGTHATFETYLRERWGVGNVRRGDELAEAVEVADLRVLGGRGVTVAQIRLMAHTRAHPGAPAPQPNPNPGSGTELPGEALLPHLRWLLTQSAGSIADVAHQLETRADDVDQRMREQLRDDVLVLDEELAVLKARLVAPIDWDAEYNALLAGEIPPFEDDADEDEERS
jgi:hypothetical protein